MPIRIEPHSEIIPGYTLVERLGGGGFGEVWKATAPGGLLKAIKIVHGDMDTIGEESQRADQELRALKRVTTVRHPYILSLERFDIIEGRLLIVMELADRNLWDRFKECRQQALPGIPKPELLNYLEETAEALDLMNIEYQLQHLDIKPQNLFLVYNHIKVADFGLVKDLKDRVAATVTGGVTPVYAAPETFDGWVSRFCDQYSLAIVYQELLTGKRPFSGTNVHQLVMQHVQDPPNLSTLPPEDQVAISKALAKNPEKRHNTCMEMIRALRAGAQIESAALEDSLPLSSPGAQTTDPENSTEAGPPKTPVTEAELSTTAVPGVMENFDSPAIAVESGLKGVDEALPSRDPADFEGNGYGKPLAQALWEKAHAKVKRPQSAVSAPRSELAGEGVLLPALVIGLGYTALQVLRHFRHGMVERFQCLENLPNIRLLFLDTDPDALTAATDRSNPGALDRSEVLVTRLNRASHYLKPRHDRPKIDSWFDPSMLYRIQRNEETGGVRALGRLAFFGNYRTITARLRAELTACSEMEVLTRAAKNTGLALRSNKPRVYIVASLAGGTGGGMFIDLAYVVQDLLQQLGYELPEIVGLFFLPAADAKLSRTMALGNAYAALTELNHFTSPEVTFYARFDEREGVLSNPNSPFARGIFLSASPETQKIKDLVQLAGEYLGQELTTPLGRMADASRMTAAAPASSRRSMLCQTFGLYRYSWPRRMLLQRASRRFCCHLVQHWLAKESQPVREHVSAWIKEQWEVQELGADALIGQFQEACEKTLGRPPEAAFTAVTDHLTRSEVRILELGPSAIQETLKTLDGIVGQRAEIGCLQAPAVLEETLHHVAEAVVKNWQAKLDQLTVHLLEQPEFRLAGVEEAIRQGIRLIEQILTHHEPLGQELSEKSTRACERLQTLVAGFSEIVKTGRKGQALIAELIELLKLYPKWRYQNMVLRKVNYTYTSLRGYLSDQVREVGFYRLRLRELAACFERAGVHETSDKTATRILLYPVGCNQLDDAVNNLFPEMTTEELAELDCRIQRMIQQQFMSLKYICTTSAHLVRDLENAMLAEVEQFVADRLHGTNVVKTFFDRYPEEDAALDRIVHAFEEATPNLLCPRLTGHGDLAFLSVPDGWESQFKKLSTRALPQARVISTPLTDELYFYREDTRFTISDLEQLDTVGEDAYHQMQATEHFTPHSRQDITHWHEIPANRSQTTSLSQKGGQTP